MIDIQEFADKVGIARSYQSVTGETVQISEQARLAALGAMGLPIHDPVKLADYVARSEEQYFTRMLDPVLVADAGARSFTLLRTPAALSEEAKLKLTLTLEDGTVIKDENPLYEAEIADYKTVAGVEYDLRRIFLPSDLPLGYHHLEAEISDGSTQLKAEPLTLIVAPTRCYVPEVMQQGRKVWGLSVQLYAVRSKRNWGVGDFADLKDLLKYSARRGASFVGLNPLHAGYPANPDPDMVSPYSPSSRIWLNIIYISVEDLPEYVSCYKAVELVNSPSFQQKLRALREREFVDYRQVLELKLQVLRVIFEEMTLDDRRSLRGRKFIEFMEKGGQSLLNMAAYDALQASLYAQGINAWGFDSFPKEYRQADSPFVAVWRQEHEAEIRFYCYLQFAAQEQLQEAFAEAKKRGMLLGTYRDLAVGVSPGSCDVWSDSCGVYRRAASLGAPPDPLGPNGQSWGLAPMDPYRMREQAYQPLIEMYRANMRSCGALRIDHAAGLARYWWVPPENHPTNGAYVQNNMHDVLGIIALESVRSQCLIIAEDLGTIPQELRDALKKYGMYSYKLFFGERAYDGGFIAPQDYEPQAMAAVTTHDMPTLYGWWKNLDLTLGEKFGIYTSITAARLAAERRTAKQRMLDSLHGLLSAGPEVPRFADDIPEMTPALVKAIEVHMCRGSCALYSAQLEDFIGVEKPVNIPGTFREYPNWRRKLTMNLDEIFSRSEIIELTDAMTAARESASTH